jgi:hypothetical protein
MGEPLTHDQSSLEVVSRHETGALAELEAATGGAPLCGVDGSRQSVKAGEGAVVALAEVRRALAREGRTVSALSLLDDVRVRWTGGAGGALAARAGSDEYFNGGLHALDSLGEDLQRAAHDEREVADQLASQHEAAMSDRLAGSLLVDQSAFVSEPASPALRWPRRRRVIAAVIMVGLSALVGATAGWTLVDAPLWTVLTAAAVVLSSLALALFVPRPGEGWRPDFGCAPCAAAGLALAVAAPWLAIETAPDGGRAALAVALGGAALARRLTEPPVCEAR